MALKNTGIQTLSDQQRLEHLAKLCEELQAAVDRAGDHRRLLEDLKQTAQELLTDAESKSPAARRKNARKGAK
jgi:DNA-binding protein H-NS